MSLLFLEEILQQPQALREVLDRYLNKERDTLEKAKREFKRGYDSIVFTGMGSSYFASHIAANLLNENGITSFACEAGELFYYNLNGLKKNHLIVDVSQSGETVEVKKIIEKLKGEITVIGVTNAKDSYLGRQADLAFPVYAGREEMTTSKTYINTIAVLLLLAFTLTDGLTKKIKEELRRIPDLIQGFLKDWEKRIEPIVKFLGEIPFLSLISRGPSFSSVLQGSVILKEGAHIYTEGLSGASFRHGPMEIAGRAHRAIIFAPYGKTSHLNIAIARELSRLGTSVLLISNVKDIEYKNKNLYYLKLPLVSEYLFPMLDIIPIELLIIKIAEKKGFEPGALLIGNKVTIKE